MVIESSARIAVAAKKDLGSKDHVSEPTPWDETRDPCGQKGSWLHGSEERRNAGISVRAQGYLI
jgi:hypothetical protein